MFQSIYILVIDWRIGRVCLSYASMFFPKISRVSGLKQAEATTSLNQRSIPTINMGLKHQVSAEESKVQRSFAHVEANFCFWEPEAGVSKNRDTPKWMVYSGNPIEMDDLGVPFFWKHPYEL